MAGRRRRRASLTALSASRIARTAGRARVVVLGRSARRAAGGTGLRPGGDAGAWRGAGA